MIMEYNLLEETNNNQVISLLNKFEPCLGETCVSSRSHNNHFYLLSAIAKIAMCKLNIQASLCC